MQRVWVVGLSGSGKTTLAHRLGELLGVPHIEMDALNWGPNWTPAGADLLGQRVQQAIAADGWTLDGNYSATHHLVAARADTVVWLDLPLWLILWRLSKRSFQRSLSQEPLWNGNRESFRTVFFSRESLFIWTFRSWSRHKHRYPAMQRDPALAHLTWVRLRTPKEVSAWLALQEQAARQPTQHLA